MLPMKSPVIGSVNRILHETSLISIKSQTGKALKQQSKSDVHRVVSKLQRSIQLFQGINQQICDYLESK